MDGSRRSLQECTDLQFSMNSSNGQGELTVRGKKNVGPSQFCSIMMPACRNIIPARTLIRA